MYIDFILKEKNWKGTGIDISKLAIKTAKTMQKYNRFIIELNLLIQMLTNYITINMI